MSSRAMLVRRHCIVHASRPPPLPCDAIVTGRFTCGPVKAPEKRGEGLGEKAKQTMENVLGAAKDTSQKLKDRVMGTGPGVSPVAGSHPSRNPELNHGVETTDSSCEDVRDRPGGYS